MKDFPLVGVSLQYELSYTNVLNILELGGIPLMAEERGPMDPVVVGGGPAAMNPEPVAPFFDALVLGDGEEAVLEVADVVRDWKAARGTRRELWQALSEVEGVYVPALFDMAFDPEGRLQEIRPLGPRNQVSRRVLADLESVPLSPRVLVPTCQIVHDRLNVEISRGCTRGCRYCQAGILYRPVRERRPENILAWVDRALAATGFEEVSLLTLSAGDYQALPWLLSHLMDRLEPQKVALSLPSLRADTLTPEVMAQITRVRRTGLTIAPEAGSERLRAVVNKNLPEEVIIASAQAAFKAGWRLLKLYFMIGLPTETAEDLAAIAQLTRQVMKAGPAGMRPRLNVSLSSFIPKAHTPFQWEAQAGLTESQTRLHGVKNLLRQPGVELKWNSAAQSWLEGIFSRGDRRLAPVLLAAYRRGCRLDAWSEHLRLEPWRQAFQEAGVDPEGYHRSRDQDELLPWDHLEAGVSREFPAGRAGPGLPGAANPGLPPGGLPGLRPLRRGPGGPAVGREPAGRGPLAAAPARPAGPGLLAPPGVRQGGGGPLAGPPGAGERRLPQPAPRRAAPGHELGPSSPAPGGLPRGPAPGGGELVRNHGRGPGRRSGPRRSCRQPEPGLARGREDSHGRRASPGAAPPPMAQTVYQVESPDPVFAAAAAADFLDSREFPVVRRRPKGDRTINVRPLVAALEVLDGRHLKLCLNQAEKDNLKVTELLGAIFSLTASQVRDLQIVKVQVI